MSKLCVIVSKNNTRRWQAEIIAGLCEQGHDVSVQAQHEERATPLLNLILWAEKTVFSRGHDALSGHMPIVVGQSDSDYDLTLNLTSKPVTAKAPVIDVIFDHGKSFEQMASCLCDNHLPSVSLRKDGVVIGQAYPMVDNQLLVSRALEDVLARTVSLVLAIVEPFLSDEVSHGALVQNIHEDTEKPFAARPLWLSYIGSAVPGLVAEVARRWRFRFAHWRVGYRFIDGPGVAEKGDLSGKPWMVLPDDGTHFYADPFPFEHQGQHYIFVEDYPHETGKAVISVSKIGANGKAGVPQLIIEEPYHLSYPQVFERDGEIWMLPESSAGQNLVLYRAEKFPHKWVQHKILFENVSLSDATLLEHENKLWLFATEQSGGSTSDMQVVFSADHLEGPWTAHPANPIVIDRRCARPGGAFVQVGKKILLPVQDGTLTYGGGLGLSEIKSLGADAIEVSAPKPIKAKGFWPYPMIHTLNRQGRLEVIDGIARVRK